MKKKISPIAAAVLAIAAVLVVVLMPKQTGQTTSTNSETTSKSVEAPANNLSGDIVINAADVEEDSISVLNYTLDGNDIGLLAVKDGDDVHVSFNTCQVCNGSPRAYFKQKGSQIVCQNCGNSFPFSAIGREANGCNPITIDDYISKTDDGVVISREFLEENIYIFNNWQGA